MFRICTFMYSIKIAKDNFGVVLLKKTKNKIQTVKKVQK